LGCLLHRSLRPVCVVDAHTLLQTIRFCNDILQYTVGILYSNSFCIILQNVGFNLTITPLCELSMAVSHHLTS